MQQHNDDDLKTPPCTFELRPHVFVDVVKVMIDLETASALLLVDREWADAMRDVLPDVCAANYRRRLPGFGMSWSLPFALTDLKHRHLLSGIETMSSIYWRKPRHPYRKALTPFVNGSMFCTGVGRTVAAAAITTSHIKHLIMVFQHIASCFPADCMAPVTRLNLRVWAMFLVLDYCRHALARDPGIFDGITGKDDVASLRRAILEKAVVLEKDVTSTMRRSADKQLKISVSRLRLDLEAALQPNTT
jgi:hypothetical protein